MIHDKTIRVGACGWDHIDWPGAFYPDDLPEDWRLSYYANEFSSILVPEDVWQANDADFEQWVEDVPDDFRFYFLTSFSVNEDESVRKRLGETFAGFVGYKGDVDTALIHFSSKNLREWKNWLLETRYNAIFLTDENLQSTQLANFKSLVELMGK